VPVPTFVSSAASSAATFTMPAYNIGDMIIVYAFQFTTTTPVVNPDGSGGPTSWNTIYNTTGTNTQAVTIAYRIAHIVGLTSATWTGATRMLIQVWRNTSRGAPPTPIVQSVAATTAGTFPALTIARPGMSAVSQALGAAAGTAVAATSAADVTRDNTQGSAPIAVLEHSNSNTLTAWAAHTATITTSSKFISAGIEIQGGRDMPGHASNYHQTAVQRAASF
jgi:hypothetical protein